MYGMDSHTEKNCIYLGHSRRRHYTTKKGERVEYITVRFQKGNNKAFGNFEMKTYNHSTMVFYENLDVGSTVDVCFFMQGTVHNNMYNVQLVTTGVVANKIIQPMNLRGINNES